MRITDLSGAIGGEELAALLPCSLEEAVIVAERVREAFESSGIVDETGPVNATVSIGAAGGPAAPSSRPCWAAADTARSIRPSAAAAIASRRPRSCRCRWKTGGARPRGHRASATARRPHPCLARAVVSFRLPFVPIIAHMNSPSQNARAALM